MIRTLMGIVKEISNSATPPGLVQDAGKRAAFVGVNSTAIIYTMLDRSLLMHLINNMYPCYLTFLIQILMRIVQ